MVREGGGGGGGDTKEKCFLGKNFADPTTIGE